MVGTPLQASPGSLSLIQFTLFFFCFCIKQFTVLHYVNSKKHRHKHGRGVTYDTIILKKLGTTLLRCNNKLIII